MKKSERKEKLEKPPALYDLTSLQRDANRVLGYTAKQTLDYAQSLYEKKLLTYPRTDSRYLTEDMEEMLPGLIQSVYKSLPAEGVEKISVNAVSVINSKKVTDHHAIIPTREVQNCNLAELPKGELAILQLVATRLYVSVGTLYRYAETVIELECGGKLFSAKGKTVLDEGWKSLVRKNETSKKEGKEQKLLDVSDDAELAVIGMEIKEGKTTPPKHFTDVIHFESRQWKYSKCKGAG